MRTVEFPPTQVTLEEVFQDHKIKEGSSEGVKLLTYDFMWAEESGKIEKGRRRMQFLTESDYERASSIAGDVSCFWHDYTKSLESDVPRSLNAYKAGISQDDWDRMGVNMELAIEDVFEGQGLSRMQKEVLRRRANPFVERQSEASVAKELGISRSTVRTHYERGMKKFRRPDSVAPIFGV